MKPVLPRKIITRLKSAVVIAALLGVVMLFTPQAQAACTNPAGAEGKIIYNADHKTLQFCDNTNWIAMNQPTTVDLTNGLVNHWKLEEAGTGPFIDDVGTNDCTVTSGTMTSLPGKDGNAIEHTGDDSNCGVMTVLSNVQQFTMAAWMKRQVSGAGIYVGHGNNNTDTLELSQWNDGNAYFVVSDPGGTWEEGYVALPGTSWHHMVMVYDGTQTGNANRLKAYINGAPVTLGFNGTIPATTPVAATNFTFADSSSGDGHVDDVRIYNRPLSASEAQALYENVGGSNVSGLINHWKADSVAGATLDNDAGSADCSLTGTYTSIPGVISNAVNFAPGLGDCGVVTTGIDGVSAVTLSGWFKRNVLGTSFVFGKSGTNAQSLNIFADTDRYWFRVSSATAGNEEGYFMSNDTDWRHIAMVFDGTQTGNANRLKVYLNGVPVALTFSGTIPATTPSAGLDLEVSTSAGDFAADDLRVYNRALTEAEVLAIMGRCTSPTGDAGDIIYGSIIETVQFCNGLAWTPISSQRSVPNTSNLVAHYKLDHAAGTSATDSAGAHTGTLNNFTVPAAWTAGHIGSNSLNFDGTNDSVALATPADFAFTVANKYSWVMWLNPDNFTEWNAFFGTYTSTDSAPGISFVAHTSADVSWGPVTNGIAVGMSNSYGPNNFLIAHSTNNALTAGSWSHVAITYDGALALASRFKIFVNGVDVTATGDVAVAGTLSNYTPTNARLGNNGWTGENYDGRMDDFRFYTRVLTDDEIRRLAAFGPVSGSCTNPAATAGMMIYNNTANVVQYCNGKDWVAAGR